jgi:hypothetical protein
MEGIFSNDWKNGLRMVLRRYRVGMKRREYLIRDERKNCNLVAC